MSAPKLQFFFFGFFKFESNLELLSFWGKHVGDDSLIMWLIFLLKRGIFRTRVFYSERADDESRYLLAGVIPLIATKKQVY